MNVTLQSLFEARVDRDPDRIALSSVSGRMSYGELERRANRLANRLRELGVGPESLVGICLPRDLDLVVAVVAVIKAGGAYVPLDSEHPKERLAFYVEDSGASVLITTTAMAVAAPETTAVIRLDSDAAQLELYPESRPEQRSQPDNLAYVIYTSGSTGKPKGVMVTIENVVRLFTETEHSLEFSENDVWTLFHSYAFDVSVWEIWGALLYGGRLIVLPFALSRSPGLMAKLIHEEGVTVLTQTPSAFRQIGRALIADSREHGLRWIVFCGEALDFASLRPWVARFGAERTALINMYGITETTVHTSYRRLTRDDVEQASGSLIGGPIPDLGMLVLDERLLPVAPGQVGEIFVTGPGVARGYLNRPELTAQRFIEIDGKRAYRSGDLARPTADGDFEYLGRIDHQVKIRGFRIELGEISARLGGHSEIRDNAVIAVGQGEEAKIVAYCVPRNTPPAPADLRRYLAPQVPDYMVPSAFVFLDALPLTVNGKLDRSTLPPAEEAVAAFREPVTETERLLAGIWCDVLGLEQVGRDDSFIALGGQSLAAAQVVARIARERGADLSLGAFLRAPTLADLSRTVDRAKRIAVEAPPVPVSHDRPLPATAAQQRLWFQWRFAPSDAAYNETLTIRMAEGIDAIALHSALLSLGRRHESLRTTFLEIDGDLAQVVGGADIGPLGVRNAASESEALQFAAEMARVPFDLVRGPLWRTLLVRLGHADFRLYVTVHHIIWDALSEGVFVRELEQIYRSVCRGEDAALPPLAFQCADAAVWERHRLSSGAIDPQIEYWKTKLAGELPIVELPSNRLRPPNPSPAGFREPLFFDPAATAALKDFASREGSSVFQVLLAILKCLLHRYTGVTDSIVGTVTNGRQAAGMEALIGYYVWPLVLRTQIDGSQTFRELLARVRETAIEAHDNPDVPLEKLIDLLRPARRSGVQPLFQIVFAMGPRMNPPGCWTWRHYDVFTGCSKFDLSLQLEDLPGGIAGHFEYKTDVVDADLVRRMAGHFKVMLEAAVENPERPVEQLPILTEPEWAEFREWNGRRVILDRSQCAHDLFEAQALRSPNELAVVFGSRSLTYAELDRRANQLAHRLQQLGARPDTLIGMCLDRSLEAIVAIVGILKSGAAFVPLDPTYPADRVRFMIEDSGVPAIVTARSQLGLLGEAPSHLLVIEAEAANLAQQPVTRPPAAVHPRNLAYMVYTSGSTGTPKGVLIEHRTLVNQIHTCGPVWQLRQGVRVLQFARFSFDASVWEIGLALAAGATLVMAPQTSLMSPRELAAVIRDRRVEVSFMTASVLALLDPAEAPGLRTIVCGGEACPSELVNRWAPGRRFINAYGPTEATICSSAAVCVAGEGKPSIGAPLPNTEQWVVDRAGQPMPVGIPGELWIGGAGLARGYHRRPELTAERFRQNPFSVDPAARIYRTGDLVKWRPDGALDYLGRIDSQVKLRGFRVELGEIESILRQFPRIADAAVVVQEGSEGTPRLIAYVIPQPELMTSA